MTYGGVDVYIHLFLDLGTAWKMSGQHHALAALLPGNSSWYQYYRGLDGPQSRSGRYGGVNILDSTGTRTPTPRLPSP
jgi:hypothetical protein